MRQLIQFRKMKTIFDEVRARLFQNDEDESALTNDNFYLKKHRTSHKIQCTHAFSLITQKGVTQDRFWFRDGTAKTIANTAASKHTTVERTMLERGVQSSASDSQLPWRRRQAMKRKARWAWIVQRSIIIKRPPMSVPGNCPAELTAWF